MVAQIISVPGVRGDVGIEPSFGRTPTISVGGQSIEPSEGTYLLPGPRGKVVAQLAPGSRVAAYPGLIVDGKTYRAGSVPAWLWVVALIPLVLALEGNPVMGIAGVLAAVLNLQIARRPDSETVFKVAAMGVVLLAAVLASTLLAGLIAYRTGG